MKLLAELFPEHTFSIVDKNYISSAQTHLDGLTKPVGSLGRLEEIASRLYAIAQGQTPLSVEPGIMFTFAGDHGVANQHVSPFPQIVTRQMVHNFLAGGAAINVLCKTAGLALKVVDAGCAGIPFTAHPLLLDRRLDAGTNDISQGPAMSREICVSGLRSGFELAQNAAAKGYKCVCAGEMGIANTTSAGALFCAFLHFPPETVAGPGCGASANMVNHKKTVLATARAANADTLARENPVDILAALGGFEIVEMAGLMLGAAASRLPFIVDGYISTAAYVAARAIFPAISGYAFLAHNSAEPAYQQIMERIDGHPLLQLDMRLGEGTGAALAYGLLKGSAAIFNDMATLAQASVSATGADRIDQLNVTAGSDFPQM